MVAWTFASATSKHQKHGSLVFCVCHVKYPRIVVVWTSASGTNKEIRTVFVVDASSLRKAIDEALTSIHKGIQGKVCAVSTLSFHPTTKNPGKQLQNLFRKRLKICKEIVICHCVVNILSSRHKANDSLKCSPDVIFILMEPFMNSN